MDESNQALQGPQRRELVVVLKREDEPKKKKDFWEKLQAFATVLTPLVLAYFTWQATGQIDTYVKQRQLEVASASAMNSVLEKLLKSTTADANKHAVELANFGRQAALPLLYVLGDSNDARAEAASKGLESLALTAPDEVCGKLVALVANQTGIYRVGTHSRAVSILGRTGCLQSTAALTQYRGRIELALVALQQGAKSVSMFEDTATRAKLEDLRNDVDRALQHLSTAKNAS
jgi:hypothetical protein